MISAMAEASATERAKMEGQSSERQAGTIPRVLNQPRVGLRPTRFLEGGGDAAGAGGVGAEGEADESGGDRAGGTGARAAGDHFWVEGIARNAVG